MGKVIYPNVPLVKQVGKMSCGIACVEMLWLYRKRKSDSNAKFSKADKDARNKLSPGFKGVPGNRDGVLNFAKAMELASMDIDSSVTSSDEMGKKLTKAGGPIWYAGTNNGMNKSTEGGHVVVITGVDGDTLIYNDPWMDITGKDLRLKIDKFFAKLNFPDNPWPVLYLRK